MPTEDPKFSQFWQFNAGQQWNPVISVFCEKHKIDHQYRSEQQFDLIVQVYSPSGELFLTYGFELKADDLRPSLFSKDSENAQKKFTSLRRELEGDPGIGRIGYLNGGFDHLYLVYLDGQLSYQGNVALNSLLDDYPTVRRKSYFTREKAIAGIHKIVLRMEQSRQLGIQYVYFSFKTSLAKMLYTLDGVSRENAIKLSEAFEHNPFKLAWSIVNPETGQLLSALRSVWPDNKNGTYHHMVNKLYDYFLTGEEPSAKKFTAPPKQTPPPEEGQPSRRVKKTKRKKPICQK